MDIKNVLSEYFCESNGISGSLDQYQIEYINARELLVDKRIDLIAKLKYVESRFDNSDNNFFNDLYCKHIEAFSNGTFTEPGKEWKNTVGKYKAEFDKIINSIKDYGFNDNISIIPVGKNNVILDGAHRVAVAIYLNIDIPIIRFDHIEFDCSINFFKSRLLEEKYLDYLMVEYSQLVNNVYLACLWPITRKYGGDMNKVYDMFSDVITIKEITLNYNGLFNLITQAYNFQSWIGNVENQFSGANSKVDSCYNEGSPITVVLFNANGLNEVLKIKEKIRSYYNIEKHAIHITDNQEETIQLTKIFFNSNSIDFLNIAKPYRYKKFYNSITELKDKAMALHIDLRDFSLTSSSVLAAYGLRENKDIDIVYSKSEVKVIESDIIDNHNKYFESNKYDIIYNPENFFYFNDLKFLTLNSLIKFKKARNEDKDRDDIKLIETLYTNASRLQKVILNSKINFKVKGRNVKHRIRNSLIKILKSLKLLKVVKIMYSKIKG